MTRNRCCDASSTNRASQPFGPEETAATASQAPSFPTRCSSSCRHICGSPLQTSDATSRGPCSCRLFQWPAALGLALLLGHHGGEDITVILLLLVLLNLDGHHHLGGMAQPQVVHHLGQLLQVGQPSTGQVHLNGHWQPHCEGGPSSPGGQNSRREASTSDSRWLLPVTTRRHLVAFCTGVS